MAQENGSGNQYQFKYERFGKTLTEKEQISARVSAKSGQNDKDGSAWSCVIDRIELSEKMKKNITIDVSKMSLDFDVRLNSTGMVKKVVVPKAAEVAGQTDFCAFLVQQCIVALFPDINGITFDPSRTWNMSLPGATVFSGENAEVFGRGLQEAVTLECRTIDEIALGTTPQCKIVVGEGNSDRTKGINVKLFVLYDVKNRTIQKSTRLEIAFSPQAEKSSNYANVFSLTKQ